MQIHLPDRIAGTKDALFVLEAEFPGASEQRTVHVETNGPVEALDLRGNQVGGTYIVPIGLERLHVPMRVKSDGTGHATITVRCAAGPESGDVTTHRMVLDAPATAQRGARPAGKLAVAVLVLAGLGVAGAFLVPKFLGGPKVPNVVHQTQAQAERSIRDADYLVDLSSESVSDPDLVGRVVRTIPAAGSPLTKREPVELIIGMAEEQRVQVPDLLGQSAVAALAALELEDLQANEEPVDVDDPAQVDVVVRQSPQGGAYVAKGTSIDVGFGRMHVIAEGPKDPAPTDPGPKDPTTDPTTDPIGAGPTTDGGEPTVVADDGGSDPTPPPTVQTPGMTDDPAPSTIASDEPAPTIPAPSGRSELDDRTVPMPDPAEPKDEPTTEPKDEPEGPTDVTEPPPAVDDGDLPGPGPGPERDGSADAGDDAGGVEEPELVIVPSVKGLDTAAAEKKFDDIGLFAIVDYEEVANPGWDGKVLRQSPEPGTKVGKNTQVFLVVGRKKSVTEPKDAPKDPPKDEPKDEPIPGPRDEPKVEPKDEPKDEPKVEPKDEPTVPAPKDTPDVKAGTVPDLVAQPRAVAEGLVRKAGFYAQIELEVTADLPDGQVLSQEPAAGTALGAGGTVKLIVAREPIEEGVEVPNVIGRTRTEATRILRNESFLVRVSYGGGVPTDQGRVTDQAPPPGTRAPRRSWVEIVIASGSGPARAARGGEPTLDDGQPDAPSDPTDSGTLRRPVAVPPGPTPTPPPTPRGAEPPPPVRLPDRDSPADIDVPAVVRANARAAIVSILKAGLVPIIDSAREGGAAAPGTVISQMPEAGTKVRAGDLIRMKVVMPAARSNNVFVPNALGSGVDRLRSRLAVAGIRVELVELDVPNHPYAKTQRVAGQYPAGTTARDYAKVVTVWVIK